MKYFLVVLFIVAISCREEVKEGVKLTFEDPETECKIREWMESDRSTELIICDED